MRNHLNKILVISIVVLALSQLAGAVYPNVSSGEIPNSIAFWKFTQNVDANGVLNLQRPTPSVIALSGYYNNMNNYVNIFFVQGEIRGFSAATTSGVGGGGSAPT